MKIFKIILAVLSAVVLFVGGYIYGKPGSDFLNMATVTTFESSENGVLLITEDGNGYYIEK